MKRNLIASFSSFVFFKCHSVQRCPVYSVLCHSALPPLLWLYCHDHCCLLKRSVCACARVYPKWHIDRSSLLGYDICGWYPDLSWVTPKEKKNKEKDLFLHIDHFNLFDLFAYPYLKEPTHREVLSLGWRGSVRFLNSRDFPPLTVISEVNQGFRLSCSSNFPAFIGGGADSSSSLSSSRQVHGGSGVWLCCHGNPGGVVLRQGREDLRQPAPPRTTSWKWTRLRSADLGGGSARSGSSAGLTGRNREWHPEISSRFLTNKLDAWATQSGAISSTERTATPQPDSAPLGSEAFFILSIPDCQPFIQFVPNNNWKKIRY